MYNSVKLCTGMLVELTKEVESGTSDAPAYVHRQKGVRGRVGTIFRDSFMVEFDNGDSLECESSEVKVIDR